MVTCIGGHENAEWPCWNSKPTSCQRPCNRSLKCGWHKCELVCHSVPNISSMKVRTYMNTFIFFMLSRDCKAFFFKSVDAYYR